MRLGLHSKAVAAAVSVLALGTIGLTALTSGSSGAAGLRAEATTGSGYWLAGSDGGVFAFGTARFYGSLAGKALAAPITGIVATGDDRGYWLTGRDGSIYPFGDAVSKGSMAGQRLAGPIVAITATHPAAGAPATGPRGPAGARGAAGANGTNGTNGLAGSNGTNGVSAAPNFAYIYNTASSSVAIESDIPFSNNSTLVGFTHTAGSTLITVVNSGTYRINTSVSTDVLMR